MAKLLIVDDDEICRLILGSILQDAGHIVLFAHDGEQALEQLRKHTFDAVLTDLAMPTMNGLRLVQAMKETGYEMPIIAISGQNAEQLLLAEDYGAAATLFKPVDRYAAVDTVQNVLAAAASYVDPWW